MPHQAKLSLWKNFFLSNKNLDSSDHFLGNMLKASSHSVSFPKAFEEISKNDGVSFLILDPTETHLQILHHGHVLGGNWSSPSKKLVAVLGCDSGAKPVQIVQKSIKNIKEKSFSLEDFEEAFEEKTSFKDMKNPEVDFLLKNILPITNALTKIFVTLDSTTPFEVAKALFEKLPVEANLDTSMDSTSVIPGDPTAQSPEKDIEDKDLDQDVEKEDIELNQNPPAVLQKKDILFAIQFCHLCAQGKISPVLYSLANDPEVTDWFLSVCHKINLKKSIASKCQAPSNLDSDSESGVSSPENKILKKDHYLINTMIKLHDMIDKSSKNKEDKEPGFKRLETHRKTLILNASAVPPFNKAAEHPKEFLTNFLAKKSQFKAKDMLLHRFHSDKVAFNPNSTFVTNLWNAEFFWILPDSPSGVSIFYCPEPKSSNSYELEKERNLALIDKVNQSDIEKLAKQKTSLPSSLMDLVWTT